jgi:hypothetical protein
MEAGDDQSLLLLLPSIHPMGRTFRNSFSSGHSIVPTDKPVIDGYSQGKI